MEDLSAVLENVRQDIEARTALMTESMVAARGRLDRLFAPLKGMSIDTSLWPALSPSKEIELNG